MPWFICDYMDWQIKANKVEDTWEVLILDIRGERVRLYRLHDPVDEQTALSRGEQIFRDEEEAADKAGKRFP